MNLCRETFWLKHQSNCCLRITSYWQILVLIAGIGYSQSECPCVCVGWRVIGGVVFYKQRQDLRDYSLGLFNGECKTCPWGNKVPANSGSASLHKFKSLNIPSLYDWPHTASVSTRNVLSTWCNLHLPFPIFLLVLLGSGTTLRKWPRSPLWLAVRGRMLMPIGGWWYPVSQWGGAGGEIPGLASEIIIVSIPPPPPPPHFFVWAAAPGL